MKIQTAKECFKENAACFLNSDSEKYNLYTGLYRIAAAIAEIQQELQEMKHQMNYLKVRQK